MYILSKDSFIGQVNEATRLKDTKNKDACEVLKGV